MHACGLHLRAWSACIYVKASALKVKQQAAGSYSLTSMYGLHALTAFEHASNKL